MPTDTIGESEAVAGAHVYTVTCGSGASQAQASASATYCTSAPAVTLNVPSILALGVPQPISWNYNVYPCNGTGGQSGDGWSGGPKAPGVFGAARQTVTESTPGTVTFGITCGSGAQIVQAQATATVVVPQVSITASANALPVNSTLKLTWNANVEPPCTSSIAPGSADGWGTVLLPAGSVLTTEVAAGTYTYTVSCSGAQASTQVTFTGGLVTLTANASSVGVHTPVTLTWTSPSGGAGCAAGGASACTASGGTSDDGWSGNLALSGSMSITESSAGSFDYAIRCTGAPPSASANAEVNFTDRSVPSTGSSGKSGGGGGALDPLTLMLLGLLACGRMRRRLSEAGEGGV